MTIHEHEAQSSEQELTAEQKLAKVQTALVQAADRAWQIQSHEAKLDEKDLQIKALEEEAEEQQRVIDQLTSEQRYSMDLTQDLAVELINGDTVQGRDAIQLVVDVKTNTSGRLDPDETTVEGYSRRLERVRAGREVFIFGGGDTLLNSGVIEEDAKVKAFKSYDGSIGVQFTFPLTDVSTGLSSTVEVAPLGLEFGKEAAAERYLENGLDKARELFLQDRDDLHDHQWSLGQLLERAAAFRQRCDDQVDDQVGEYHTLLAEHSVDFICHRLATDTSDARQIAQQFALFAPERVPEVVTGIVLSTSNTMGLERHESFLTTMVAYQKGIQGKRPNDLELAEAWVEVLKTATGLWAEQQSEQE
jgi:hypothetical protein